MLKLKNLPFPYVSCRILDTESENGSLLGEPPVLKKFNRSEQHKAGIIVKLVKPRYQKQRFLVKHFSFKKVRPLLIFNSNKIFTVNRYKTYNIRLKYRRCGSILSLV